MRDPLRIRRIIRKLEEAWELVPDWRLGQLISNLQGPGWKNVFHPEDDDWEKWIDQFIVDSKEVDFKNDKRTPATAGYRR